MVDTTHNHTSTIIHNATTESSHSSDQNGFYRLLNNEQLLWIFNEQLYVANIPCIYVSLFLMIVGLLGNGVTVYIYSCRLPRTSANTITILLAICDLVSCTLGIPFEIFQMRLPLFSGRFAIPCKLFKYIEFSTNILSCLALLCVAVDRHTVVHYPLSRFAGDKTKYLIAFSVTFTLLTTWPTLFLIGPERIPTPMSDLYGYDCNFDNVVMDMKYNLVFWIVLCIIYLTGYIILVVIYTRIGLAILRWKRSHVNDDLNKDTTRMRISSSNNATGSNVNDIYTIDKKYTSDSATSLRLTTNKTRSSPQWTGTKSSIRKNARLGRSTFIFICVTLVVMVGFIPYLVVKILTLLGYLSLQQWLLAFLERSYFISNAINPVIYSAFNPRFRREFLNLFSGNISKVPKTISPSQRISDITNNS